MVGRLSSMPIELGVMLKVDAMRGAESAELEWLYVNLDNPRLPRQHGPIGLGF
jgi:hypothetical protein